MEPYSKKNFQVKHGKYGSIMISTHFPSEAIIISSYPCDKSRGVVVITTA